MVYDPHPAKRGEAHCVVVFPPCGCVADVLPKPRSYTRSAREPGAEVSQSRPVHRGKSLRIDLVKHDLITSKDGAHSNAGFQPFT